MKWASESVTNHSPSNIRSFDLGYMEFGDVFTSQHLRFLLQVLRRKINFMEILEYYFNFWYIFDEF